MKPDTMPATYFMVLDADSQWLASFLLLDDAEDWLLQWEPDGRLKKVTVGCRGEWCDDGDCPRCLGW